MTSQQLIENYAALPRESQRQVEDFVEFLRQRNAPQSKALKERASEKRDLSQEPFVGMWKDGEIPDSSQWVRETRRSEWGESE